MSRTESSLNEAWRPKFLVEVDTDLEPPYGFTSHTLRGLKFRLNLLEPEEIISTIEGWNKITENMDSWGEVPEQILSIEEIPTNRGPVYKIHSEEGLWLAEVQPWGGPNIRSRARISPDHFDVPCGGFLHNDSELILLRRLGLESLNALDVLIDHLERNDLEEACKLIKRCGSSLGRYHTLAKSEWTNPPDQKRWNERFHEIEARLKAASLWRAPFTRGAPATLDIGDVRFSMFSESSSGDIGIRIGPSRLAHGLIQTQFNMPAIRDLASLLHDLSRQHRGANTELDLSHLRSSLIEGWKLTAPNSWCSNRSFSAHTGGSVIWEYEQSLLDVVEAVSNQSGRPEPAVTIIEKVPKLQKKLFNARILSAVSLMAGILCIIGTSNWINLVIDGTIVFPSIPLLLFGVFFYLRHRFNAAAPPPENPIH